jgi:uncharacterized SAM-binding protein YcdF (DUF218 family)
MMFLIRSLESLVNPIGFVWFCLTISAVVLFRKKQRGAALGAGLLSLFLFVVGATPLPEFLLARLERPFANATIANAQLADAVIVLGGFMNPSPRDAFGLSMTAAGDRWIAGVELMRQKKARAMILGGGGMLVDGKVTSEGQRVELFLKTWNVAPGEIIGLEGCRNTRQEAERALLIIQERKWTNLIVVTSAGHMPRALATLQKAGLQARPVVCDFEGLPVMEGDQTSFRLVPTIDHVRAMSLYLHEVIGWYYYWARGWV